MLLLLKADDSDKFTQNWSCNKHFFEKFLRVQKAWEISSKYKISFVVNEIYLLVFQLDLTTMNSWDPSEFSAAAYSFVFVM